MNAFSRQGLVPRSESVTAQAGDRGANLAPCNATVTTEVDGSAPAAAGYARNHIRFHIACEECAGTGRYTIDGGNPYAKLYECETCEGAGLVWAEDEELEA